MNNTLFKTPGYIPIIQRTVLRKQFLEKLSSYNSTLHSTKFWQTLDYNENTNDKS